jgi:hypothetical protein
VIRHILSAIAVATLFAAAASAQVPVAASYTNEAWKVTHGWDDVTPEAGIAWAANSKLTWQQKYSKWVGSLEKVSRFGEDGFTFQIVTPYANGKTLPAAVADCADTSMLLRVTFASWYGLPVLIKAGGNYYGHFGLRKGGAAVTSSPLCSNCDFSSMTAAQIATKGWPKNAALRAKKVGEGDDNPSIGGGGTGTWLDELLLNKRVGFLIAQLLNDAGSSSLAGTTNLYDIKSNAIQAGDVLLERWQAQGIGHTIVIKQADRVPSGKVRVEIVAGWLPPRQAMWEGSVDAHGNLSDDYFGGDACTDSSCKETYAMYGGGLKRWRPPQKVGGKWTLGVLAADKDVVIDPKQFDPTGKPSKAYWDALGHRTAEFEDLVYLPPPEELRDELLRLLTETRGKLRQKPSGCSAREHREDLFAELYDLMRDDFQKDRTTVDNTYRLTEDYLFAPLEYTKSATCCWNGATPQMGDSAVKLAIATAKQKATQGQCEAPTVFRKNSGDYQPYKTAAGAAWKPYSNDEHCPAAQIGVADDTLKAWNVTPFCTVKPFARE